MRPGEPKDSLVAQMIGSASRLFLVLIAALAIALSAGGFSWDSTPDLGSGTPDMAVVNGPSVDPSGSVTADGFSWGDGIANPAAVAG